MVLDLPTFLPLRSSEGPAPLFSLCGLVKIQDPLLPQAQLDFDFEEHLVRILALNDLDLIRLTEDAAYHRVHKENLISIIRLVPVEVCPIQYKKPLLISFSSFLEKH